MQGIGTAQLGKYELLRRIAVGGMGEVFLARERGVAGFDRIVVVKRLLPELAEKPDLVEMFIDEARIAGQVSHPNIVQIHDFGHADDAYFLAMEYVAGQNLSRITDRADDADGLPLAMAVHIVAELTRGLDAAHRARDADGRPLGIVHRDISPHNVLVSYGGDVKLMDFGIAKAANKTHRTEAGTIRGKLCYMSPEQARGDDLDVRSDIFAAGVVLWELTVGDELFAGDGVVETIRAVCEAPIPRPSERVPDYPPELERIVMAALDRDRAERTATASELGSALRAFLVDSRLHVDRDELGAFVAELFPGDVDDLSDEELSAGTSAVTKEFGGTASIPDIVPPEPDQVPAIAVPPKRRRALYALAAFGVAAAAAATVWVLATRGASDERPDEGVSSAIVEDAAPDGGVVSPIAASPAQDAGASRSDAAAVAVADPATDPKPKRDRDRPRRSKADAGTRTTAASPPDASVTVAAKPPPPDVPTNGTLSVGSRVAWATITVGSHTGRTQFRKSLPAGTYNLVADVSNNGGRFTTRATIAGGKTTKCFVEADRVACRSPR
jgi:serine/threonine-protein kinase